MGAMKVYAYKVSLADDWTHALEHAFRISYEKPLGKRLRQLSSSRVRLEEVRFSEEGIYANFVLFRSGSGPAIVSDSSRLSEIDIREDQCFGEDTACLYDPVSRYLLVQYNHHGPKASAIQEYLCHAEEDRIHSYQLAPKLSPSSEEQIRSLAVVSRLEVSFAVSDLISHPNSKQLSFGQAIDLAGVNGAETMSLTIGNRRGLALSAVKNLISNLHAAASCGEGIKKLAVKAQLDEDSPRETIDLIAERLSCQVDVPLGLGRRYHVEDRWSKLAAVLKDWSRAGYLT